MAAELEPTTARERNMRAAMIKALLQPTALELWEERLIADIARHQAVTHHDLECERCMDGLYCEERTKLCRIALGLPPLEDPDAT